MKETWKKIVAWLKCEDDLHLKPSVRVTSSGEVGIKAEMSGRYSELIKDFPIHGEIGPDDILQLSHKLDDGNWETCFVTVKQLRDAIVNRIS